uniref:(northern house mosquito) hypothetical protein n=1 Tax=Culex pipiens TaxID=7175 RepID=A0A8D8C0P0_CULPI
MFSRTLIRTATSILTRGIVYGARHEPRTPVDASELIQTATGTSTGLSRELQVDAQPIRTVDPVRSRKSRPRPCLATLLRSRVKSRPTSDSTRTPSFCCIRTDTLESTRQTTTT